MRMGIPKKVIMCKTILGVLIFLCSFSNVFSQEKALQNNYIQGILTNRLQFFVQKNNPKKSETLFYLLLKTGAIQENSNESGYAHFLEHMAFKGGKRFPKKPFTQFLKEQGLQIGVHYNAVTNYNYTLYKITVPQKASIILQKQIFNFFVDIIDGLTLSQKDIEIEKKIVLAEKEVVGKLQEHFLFKLGESSYKKRNPIGTNKSIHAVTTKKLKNFYNKWYQPKNAGVFVVGSIKPKQTVQVIQQVFGDIKNTAVVDIAKKNLYKQLTDDVLVTIDTLKSKSKVHIEMAFPHQPKNAKEKITARIFRNILQNRLDSVLKKYNTNSRVYDDYFLADVRYYSISATVKNNETTIIKDVLLEIKRIATFGVSKQELDFYIEDQKEQFQNKSKIVDNKYVANKLTDAFLGVEKMNPHQQPKGFSYTITTKAIQQIANELYTIAKKRIFVTLPKEQKHPFSKKQLDRLVQEIDHQKIEATTFKVPKKEEVKKVAYTLKTKPLFAVFPVFKEYFPKLNITKIRYKNGLEVILKPIKSSDKEIRVTGFAKGGTSFLSDKLYPQYGSTVSYIDLGGVGNLNYNQLSDYLGDKNMGLSLNITEYQRSFFGFTENKDKQEFFKFLYLKLTEARKNKQEFSKIVSEEISDAQKESLSSKTGMATAEDFKIAELSGVYFPNRNTAETVKDYKKLNLNKMSKFYKRAFSYSNDLKVIVVGNFNVKEISPLLNTYFGNLKRTNNPIQNKQLFNRGNFRNEYTFTTNKDVKTVANTLMFYNTFKYGLKNTLLQSLFKRMLRDKVVNLLREKHGFVYTPTVDVERQEGFSVVKISYHCALSDTKKAKEVLVKWLSEMEKYTISNSDFQSYKNQLLLQYRAIINSRNTYNWAFSLQNSIESNDTIAELENYEIILNNITITDFYKSIAENFHLNTLKTVVVVPDKQP